MSYWHQRDITERLQAARNERLTRREEETAIDGLLDQLSPALVMAIAGELNGEGYLTLTPVEWFDE